MKLETSTQSSQLAAAIATHTGDTPVKVRKLVKLRPTAEPKVSSTSEMAEASTMPAITAGQSTYEWCSCSPSIGAVAMMTSVSVVMIIVSSRSAQAEEGQDREDHDHQTDQVDD